MEDLNAEGNWQVALDVRLYNLILSAYANEKGPSDAGKVLQDLRCIKISNPTLLRTQYAWTPMQK